MKKFKKLLCAALTLAMASGTIVLPATTANAETTPIFPGDEVKKEWKFDFGAAGTAAEDGWTAVTPDMHYEKGGDADFGFLGTKESDYLLGDRYDGFGTQKKQMENDDDKVITLKAGGGTGLDDGIGSSGEDLYGNAGDLYYPVRFALKAEDDHYYRVQATVTTLDTSKEAEVSLYTERKHPLYTDVKLEPGEKKTVEFSVRPTPIYYQKSTPTGAIKDEMVNVCALGKNSAISSIIIQEVAEYPVFWVLGDSTVTDGNCSLPFFRLQNYTGVGTGLTKYLPRDIAMVNEGEGGLNAADSLHYDMVANRIKAGDYLYVEYGHNHKDDKVPGYISNLAKYYNLCKTKNAKLLIVSPIERINKWDSGSKQYEHSFVKISETDDTDYSAAGKKYVEDKIADDGAENIAFVELTQRSLDFYNKIVKENGDDPNAIKYYFQTAQGGATDTTHPNDAGAENLAYEFIESAKARVEETTSEAEKAVLNGFLDNITEEKPNLIPESITSTPLGGSAWPQYVSGPEYKYPTDVESVTVADGKIKDMTVNVIGTMSTYAMGVVDVYGADGEKKASYISAKNVDNSTGKGFQTVAFPETAAIADGETFKAYTWTATETDGDLALLPEEEGGERLSAEYDYIPATSSYLSDDFTYEGAVYEDEGATLVENAEGSGWQHVGSAAKTTTLGTTVVGGDDENPINMNYANVVTTGKKTDGTDGSFYLSKSLSEPIGTSGKYEVSFDIRYVNGGGMNVELATNPSASNVTGTDTVVPVFAVGDEGMLKVGGKDVGQISSLRFAKVRFVLDMDFGTATLHLAGYDPVTVDCDLYTTTDPVVKPEKITSILFDSSKVPVGIQIANLSVTALKTEELPEFTAKASSSNDERGTVTITAAAAGSGGLTGLGPVLFGDGVKLAFNFNEAVITSDNPAEMTLLEVAYNTDGTLKSVKSTPVVFEEAGTKQISAKAGNKLMLWDSVSGMKPLTEAIIAGNGEPKSLTAKLNTVITAKATANEGYVFTGWYKEGNTSKVISPDAEYSFRIRQDTSIVARFVIKPTVDDVKSFSLSADKTRVKVASGTQINLGIIDAVDQYKTPVDEVNNASAAWSCDDAALTLTDGVLTIPDGYASSEPKKTVTVTAELNGIKKSISVVLYDCDYFEDFSAVASASDWFEDTSAVPLSTIIPEEGIDDFPAMRSVGNGKALVVGNGGNAAGNNLAYNKVFDGFKTHTKMKFGFEIEVHKSRNDGKDASTTLQFIDDTYAGVEGTNPVPVFSMLLRTGDKTTPSSFNGKAVSGFNTAMLVAVDTELDFTAKTMKYTLTNAAGKVLATGDAALTAANLDRMYFVGDWSYGKFAIDNIYAEYLD